MKTEENNQKFMDGLSDRLEQKEREQFIEFKILNHCPLCEALPENIIILGDTWKQGAEIYSHGHIEFRVFYCFECNKSFKVKFTQGGIGEI